MKKVAVLVATSVSIAIALIAVLIYGGYIPFFNDVTLDIWEGSETAYGTHIHLTTTMWNNHPDATYCHVYRYEDSVYHSVGYYPKGYVYTFYHSGMDSSDYWKISFWSPAPPVPSNVMFTISPEMPSVTDTVTFIGSCSSEVAVTYTWKYEISGTGTWLQLGTGQQITHIFPQGNYNIILVASNIGGSAPGVTRSLHVDFALNVYIVP